MAGAALGSIMPTIITDHIKKVSESELMLHIPAMGILAIPPALGVPEPADMPLIRLASHNR